MKKTVHLSCEGLTKKYTDITVVSEVSIKVDTGKVVGLLGPNGAGKTTTFYMLVGLIRCDQGQIYINNNDITNCPMHTRSNLGVSYLPQEASIFRNLSVKDNIMAILETRKSLNDNEIKKIEIFIKVLSEFDQSSKVGIIVSKNIEQALHPKNNINLIKTRFFIDLAGPRGVKKN